MKFHMKTKTLACLKTATRNVNSARLASGTTRVPVIRRALMLFHEEVHWGVVMGVKARRGSSDDSDLPHSLKGN